MPVLGEHSLGLDLGADQNGRKAPGGNAHRVATNHVDDDRVALGFEVASEDVALPRFERQCADQVNERHVVERIGHGGVHFAVLGTVGSLLRKNLCVAIRAVPGVVQVLHEAD